MAHRWSMSTPTTLPRLLSTAELAEYLGMPVRTLEGWRSRAGGPPFVYFGRQVWYREDSLVEWLQTLKAGSTPQ